MRSSRGTVITSGSEEMTMGTRREAPSVENAAKRIANAASASNVMVLLDLLVHSPYSDDMAPAIISAFTQRCGSSAFINSTVSAGRQQRVTTGGMNPQCALTIEMVVCC